MKRRATCLALVPLILLSKLLGADEVTLAPNKDNTIFESDTGGLSDGSGQLRCRWT